MNSDLLVLLRLLMLASLEDFYSSISSESLFLDCFYLRLGVDKNPELFGEFPTEDSMDVGIGERGSL